jgi:hypothetical protein
MLGEATLDVSGTFLGEAIRLLILFAAQHESLRHGQGDHVRDEQAPHPTSEVREPG